METGFETAYGLRIACIAARKEGRDGSSPRFPLTGAREPRLPLHRRLATSSGNMPRLLRRRNREVEPGTDSLDLGQLLENYQ
jgi:hypothetical protein